MVFAGQYDLQSTKAVEPDLASLVNDAHPATAQLRPDLEARNGRKDDRGQTLDRA